MSENKLIIAAAGSGKTTYLVKQALRIENENVLITTYTEANAEEIRKKVLKLNKGCVPPNIQIQTWFSFLLQHGVRPYQSLMDERLDSQKIGFFLTERPSAIKYNTKRGPVYWREEELLRHYFTKDYKIYSDKISKFIYKCNVKSEGEVFSRLTKVYPVIFVDEVQDLAGWDLELIKLLFDSSSEILLVGDPRQVTYLTHHPAKHKKYIDGKIDTFVNEKCAAGVCTVDTDSLSRSHRNNSELCKFSSRLFPEYSCCEPCHCSECHDDSKEHQGVYLVREEDVERYCAEYSPVVLRYSKAVSPEWNYGKSKGLSFDRVLIYPTDKIKKYLKSGACEDIKSVRAKFYVSVTRARLSTAIVCDYGDKTGFVDGLKFYE